VQRPSVDPAFTFGVSLAVSVLLWFPTLRGAMSGQIEITDAGIRYFLALAIAWAGVYGVSALVAMYASKPRAPQSPPPDEPRHEPVPARRETDAVPVDATAQSPDALDTNAA